MDLLLTLYAVIGGAVGTAIRIALIQLNHYCIFYSAIPIPTLIANIIGSLCAGLFFNLLKCNTPSYSFSILGLCGGLTTMSTAALEGYLFILEGKLALGVLYGMLNLTLSIISIAMGFLISKIYF